MIDDPDVRGLDRPPRRERVKVPGKVEDIETIRRRALLAGRAAADVKAEDVRVMDMSGLVTYTDFFVLCTGRTPRLSRRISEEIAFRLKEEGVVPMGVEGGGEADWILMDYVDFVVHIFTPTAREFYRLDVLWKQASVETVE